VPQTTDYLYSWGGEAEATKRAKLGVRPGEVTGRGQRFYKIKEREREKREIVVGVVGVLRLICAAGAPLQKIPNFVAGSKADWLERRKVGQLWR